MSALRGALGNLPDAVFADVLESDDAYLLVLDLPGVSAERLTVRVEGTRLLIEGERETDVPGEFQYVHGERSPVHDVELPLPSDVTASGAEGDLTDGVLELRLPKRSTSQETSISIEGA